MLMEVLCHKCRFEILLICSEECTEHGIITWLGICMNRSMQVQLLIPEGGGCVMFQLSQDLTC